MRVAALDIPPPSATQEKLRKTLGSTPLSRMQPPEQVEETASHEGICLGHVSIPQPIPLFVFINACESPKRTSIQTLCN